ncbi:hypothetical protein BgiBS90_035159, partial [Biomphalaria glabrata]
STARTTMTSINSLIFVLTAAYYSLVPPVDGHGRLWEPPSRSTMWMDMVVCGSHPAVALCGWTWSSVGATQP